MLKELLQGTIYNFRKKFKSVEEKHTYTHTHTHTHTQKTIESAMYG